jgi:hypothetical protein
VLASGVKLVRIYSPGYHWDDRRHRGPRGDARFDHHRLGLPLGEDPNRSVWYASLSLTGAVAEAFGRGFIDKHAGHGIAVVRVVSPLRLLDLLGKTPRHFGLTQEIASTTNYDRTQQWSRAFYDRYEHLHGIRWRGRQSGSICIVLTDRAPFSALEPSADLPLNHPAVWPRVVRAARECAIPII